MICTVCCDVYKNEDGVSFCCDVCGRCGFCDYCSKPEHHDCELEEKIMEELKPRIRFCWECSRQLWGNHFIELEVEGHKRIMHKSCGKKYQINRTSGNNTGGER